MELIDTHCHFNDESFPISTEEGIANATKVGVTRFVVPGMDLETSERAIAIAAEYPGICFPTVGIHPHEVVKPDFQLPAELAALRTLIQENTIKNSQSTTSKPQTTSKSTILNENYKLQTTNYQLPATVVAMGEIGIDYHHHMRDETGSAQREAFAQMLQIALDLSLPAIVHGRDAYSDVLDVIRAHPGARCVLHSFEASYEIAKQALDLGCLISLTALITYPGNDALREVVAKLPLDRLMMETDAPYLPPQSIRASSTPGVKDQHSRSVPGAPPVGSKPLGARGRNNQPAYMIETAQMLAQLLNTDLDTVAAATTATAEQFFALPKIPKS